MPRLIVHLATAALAATLSAALAPPAGAAPTETALLTCDGDTYTVDGFGRGQVLHVTGTNSNFVVTRAVLGNGAVVFDSPAQADRPLVTCTTTSPTGRDYTFTGFFTPAL